MGVNPGDLGTHICRKGVAKWYRMVVQYLLRIYCYVSGVDALWADSSRDILSMGWMGISMLAAVLLV